MLGCAVLVAGCGESDDEASAPADSPPRKAAPAKPKAPEPRRAKPGGAYASNYEEAKIVCGLKSVGGIAADFELPASTPAAQVAARYARGYFPAGRRKAAYTGCLAGMRKRGG